jgi:hypothetical protein
MTPELDTVAPEEMPQPWGIDAVTGLTHPPMSPDAVDAAQVDSDEIKQRAQADKHLALVPTADPKKLTESGWAIVFPSKIDPAVVAALQPLIEHRRRLVNDETLFRVFDGKDGVTGPNQSATDWLGRFGVGLATVDPANGVPYYLTLVGSPQQISFDFQYTLDLQWSVGRLYFETPAEYEAYARAVVEYETAEKVPHRKRSAMWMTQHDGDAATTMLATQVGRRFEAKGLGTKFGFGLDSFIGAKATKAQLQSIMRGEGASGPPALLFTGSHGLEWPVTDTEGQRKLQGSIVTQEWVRGAPVDETQRLSGDDVPADAKLFGMVHFLFACFGGGCPVTDTYRKAKDGSPIQLANEPLIAQLPQRMLAKGALAVMAHIDRAWSWSFQTGAGLPQDQVMRSTIEAVLAGLPVGLALDYFNLQWSTLAARLGMLQGQLKPPTIAALANLFVARDDARNYVLFGDPAVRLRVNDMVQ